METKSSLKLNADKPWYLSAGEILKYVMPSVDTGGETMGVRGRSGAEGKRNRETVKEIMIQLIQHIFHFFFSLMCFAYIAALAIDLGRDTVSSPGKFRALLCAYEVSA